MVVEVSQLRVRYGKRLALDGVELSLGPGVNGLLGPNGAGKTTLMRVLATVAKAHHGTIRILGHSPGGPAVREIRRQLGYLPQSFGHYSRFTVREFVEYFAWLKEIPANRVPAAVDGALDRVGLSDRAGDRMKQLSGGMIRRAGIAQAIVNDPRVLLLDEPTAGLDPEQRVDFRALVRQVGREACVVISTHLVEDVAMACTRVGVLHEGRVVFEGTPGELAETGTGRGVGDTAIERGYTSALFAARGLPR